MFKISDSFKKNLAQVLCLTIAFTPVIGYAAGSGRAANLQSHGKVNYTNGTDEVVIDSSDLVTLANEIDTLEENAKWGQVQAIQSLPEVAQKNSLTGVTLDTIGNVTFDQINNAIKNSQKIDTTQSVYKLPNGSVTTNSAEEGATQVQISGATAENLSAGTAAWVDGQYIVGNGADNNSYYNRGYAEGYNKSKFNATLTVTRQQFSNSPTFSGFNEGDLIYIYYKNHINREAYLELSDILGATILSQSIGQYEVTLYLRATSNNISFTTSCYWEYENYWSEFSLVTVKFE